MNRLRLSTAVLVALLTAAPLFAQQPAREPESGLLTLDTFLSYVPQPPGVIQWQEDGSGYLRLEPPPGGEGGVEIVRYDAATGEKRVLVAAQRLTPPGASAPLPVEQFSLSQGGQKLLIFTNSQRVWRQNTRGDYWVLDLQSWKLHRIGGDAKPGTLMFAKFSPDGTRVGFVRENNLYVEHLADGRIMPLTSDGSRLIINGTFDWVYEEELFCRDGWRWSPDGQRIAYWQLNTEGVKQFQLVNNTAALYPVITSFPYPKAGETNSAARIGVISASGGATRWFEIPGDPRNHYLARMDWAAGSDEIVIQQLNRLQNTNRVMLGEARTGRVRTILTEEDAAWVDVYWGDLGSGGLANGDLVWLEGGRRFLWASERDGWRHVYSVSRDGRDIKCLTPGNYDLISVEGVDAAGGWLYFAASPENATQRYLFRARLDGGGRAERLTPEAQPGTHRYRLSPRGDLAVHTYSTFTRVPVTEIIRLPEHTKVKTLVDNRELQERLGKLRQVRSEFFRVAIGDGVELDGWMIKPPDFDPQKRYPVLFHVYGEPWGQTVLDAWNARLGMWHLLLAQRGYIVMSVDNRGTPAPRGRAWRKAIYRRIGVLNSEDQARAVRAISKWPFIDSTRVGIWGWSGGGSSSLNAIFRYPDLYQLAMAVAPVPDIRYYDTIYQERYCGLPQDHPEEYRQSSPITFAGQLRGQLLIVHGTGDDNVHYQGTEALINALVAADKPFTMMAYPNRSHAISEGPGTNHHLFGLLTRFLTERLPAGPRVE